MINILPGILIGAFVSLVGGGGAFSSWAPSS